MVELSIHQSTENPVGVT